jgi:hypothetical protein
VAQHLRDFARLRRVRDRIDSRTPWLAPMHPVIILHTDRWTLDEIRPQLLVRVLALGRPLDSRPGRGTFLRCGDPE